MSYRDPLSHTNTQTGTHVLLLALQEFTLSYLNYLVFRAAAVTTMSLSDKSGNNWNSRSHLVLDVLEKLYYFHAALYIEIPKQNPFAYNNVVIAP